MSKAKPSPIPSKRPYGLRVSGNFAAFLIVGIVIVLGIVTLTARHALPQTLEPCSSYAALLRHLDAKYDEHPIGIGATAGGNMIVVTVSPDGSWTVLVVRPDASACIVASGDGWQPAKERSDG